MSFQIAPAPIRKTIRVGANPARAFQVFTAGMARWWRPEHHIAKTPFVDLVVEPRTGGRWFERDKDWEYDQDFVTELEVRFIAESDGTTRVKLEHRDLEKYGEKAAEIRAMLDSPEGWHGALAFYAAVAKS
jgi:hypothetical protein